MKILMVGLFTGNSFDGDECLAFGFKELNHSVTKINYRNTTFINIKLLNLWKKYDLLVIGKGEAISPFILKRIQIPKILWYGDQRETIQKWVISRIKYVDLFLHTSSGKRLKEYHKLTNTPSAFFMVPCQTNLYKNNSLYNNDIFFSGSPITSLGDSIRGEILSYLSTKPNFKWCGKDSHSIVKGNNYSKEIVSSKILVSINHFNNFYKYSSDRIIHYSGGGFTISYDIPGIRDLFKYIPTFKCINSMKKLISYYLSHSDEREMLKNQIINETRQKYNTKRICTFILNLIFKNDNSLYPQFEYLK